MPTNLLDSFEDAPKPKQGSGTASLDAFGEAETPAPGLAQGAPTSADQAINMSAANGKPLSPKYQEMMRGVGNQAETSQGVQQLAASTLLPGPASKVMAEGSGLVNALKRMGISALQGGTTAASMDLNNTPGEKATKFAGGGLLSGGIQGLGEAANAVGKGVSDFAMKNAVGIRKAPKGTGTSLTDQGLWGTKGGMLQQVQDKLPAEEAKLQALVKGLNNPTDASVLADEVSGLTKKFQTPDSGKTLPLVQGDLDKVRSSAEGIRAMGPQSPSDLLALKRQGDWAGYTASGTPASAGEAEIGRTVADKARSLLSDMSSGETAATLGKEQALIAAKKALQKDPTTHQGIGAGLFFGKMPGQDIGMSSLAHVARKAGKLGEKVTGPNSNQMLLNALSQPKK